MNKLFKNGDPYIWLTAGTLTISILMVTGLIALILVKGLGMFWPHKLVHYTLKDGAAVMGEIKKHEPIPNQKDSYRTKLKVGNREVYTLDFCWIKNQNIVLQEYPVTALTIERVEWGNMYGFFKGLKVEGGVKPFKLSDMKPLLEENKKLHKRIRQIEKKEIGKINQKIENFRLKLKGLTMRQQSRNVQEKIASIQANIEELEKSYQTKVETLTDLYTSAQEYEVVISLVDGSERVLPVFQIIRIYAPNEMGIFEKFCFYFQKVWEFLVDDPREANTEGGIFPAIFGTVLMVLIMTIAVVPLGVITAVYLKEYTSDTLFARLVRISVNNLAGVPSIVFGVFGLGFFIYFVGGGIDKMFYHEALPTPTFGTGGILWASLTLALLTVPVVVVTTEEGLSSVPKSLKEASYALGATKFETLWRVVLPQATPGILTGTILAMARAAGEVAPLMITGVVKLAPSLPLDGHFPYVHLDRKFMHLGFHVYDVGFQSPNIEAALPMVYTTTLVLVMTVLALNMGAIIVRNKLRKRYTVSSI
ncbi:MAG: phosphate ABC transporter permease PstA [Candidatus Scalindua sp. AMX11]|nr:MAG: phosphate ABC transporter permease PtsA [Candidatus Scalindua sp.]NOG83237.1 phosphate ABC transporter permease PstA [Planctomycetota bacterium]RZV77609.1 MAG: phosphate ABC transporter permease PstA [Candidatus Scalindua sp. SCAELEC01]TDE63518.1 MAG: phosphate ABC transporter permease PstA [Candidatus Scalindua sp. AMX11]